MKKTHHRAIFISDLHLGSRGCQAISLLRFLKSHTCDTLYLVGDIIDLLALNRRIYFPQSHVDVIRQILKMANNGTRVVYICGNHDHAIREFIPTAFGNIEVLDEIIHTTIDGKQYVVMHGDQFDQICKHAKWLMIIGDVAYDLLMRMNILVNWVRRLMGLKYWSLSKYLKHRVKMAVNFIGNYEAAVAAEAKLFDCDGLILGHIHSAEIKNIDGVLYCNCGDWVESCTALMEDESGMIVLYSFEEDSKQKSSK